MLQFVEIEMITVNLNHGENVKLEPTIIQSNLNSDSDT